MTDASDVSIRANRKLPTDLAQVLTVAKYDAFKHLRSKRLYGIIAIIAVLIVANIALPPLLGNDYSNSPSEFAQGFISFLPTLIIIIATLFAGDAIVSEFQGRTGYLLFPNPVKRSSLYVGKMFSAIGLGFLLILLYYAIVFVLTYVVTGETTVLLIWSLLLALLYATATIAVGFMISSFLKGSTGALILTFALLFLIMPMVSGIFSITEFKPEFLLTFQGDSMSYMLQSPYPQDSSEVFDMSGQSMTIWYYYPQPWLSAGIMSAYSVVAALLGYMGFKKREMVS